MVQWLKCDSATKADKYMCGEWDYIWDTYLKIPKGDTTEIFSIGSFVTPYGKRLEMGGSSGWQWSYDVTDYAPLLHGTLEIVTGNNQELLDLRFLFIEGTPERDVLKCTKYLSLRRIYLWPTGRRQCAEQNTARARPKCKGLSPKGSYFGPWTCRTSQLLRMGQQNTHLLY